MKEFRCLYWTSPAWHAQKGEGEVEGEGEKHERGKGKGAPSPLSATPLPFSLSPYPLPLSTPATQAILGCRLKPFSVFKSYLFSNVHRKSD